MIFAPQVIKYPDSTWKYKHDYLKDLWPLGIEWDYGDSQYWTLVQKSLYFLGALLITIIYFKYLQEAITKYIFKLNQNDETTRQEIKLYEESKILDRREELVNKRKDIAAKEKEARDMSAEGSNPRSVGWAEEINRLSRKEKSNLRKSFEFYEHVRDRHASDVKASCNSYPFEDYVGCIVELTKLGLMEQFPEEDSLFIDLTPKGRYYIQQI